MKLVVYRVFSEHTKNSVFAVNRGHDGNTEIDGTAVVFHAETAVLRHAALGNVQLTHDLHARNDGGVMLLANGRHGLGKHAINAELDGDRIITSLDVNITGPSLQGGKDGGVDEADDGAGITGGGELVDGDS